MIVILSLDILIQIQSVLDIMTMTLWEYRAGKGATTKQCTLTLLNLAIVSDPNSETNKITV